MAIPDCVGVVEQGQIRLFADVTLPEHAKVYVVASEAADKPAPRIHSPRLADPDQANQFSKQVIETGSDA